MEAVNAQLRRLSLLIAIAICAQVARGHVLDEYLQSTLVVIEPDEIRLRINLTPGVEIADKVLGQIDTNGDGAISDDETAAYAERLRRDLTVRLDGRDAQLKLVTSKLPDFEELGTGHGIIQLEFSVAPSVFLRGSHRLIFENRHFDTVGVYLFNAARSPSPSIRIVKQHRNKNQSSGEIEFDYVTRDLNSFPAVGILASAVGILLGIFVALRWLKHPPPAAAKYNR